jgi:molybdenum ABC transporter molybdate-binding protein
MSKKPLPSANRKKWHKDWGVKVRVSVENRGQTLLDEPTADMLAAVERTSSISAAGRSLGISYRHAWLLIQKANDHAGQPLVATAIGGESGGGTQLTEYGRAALDVYRQIEGKLRTAAAKSLPQVLDNLTGAPTVVHIAAAISLQEVVAQILSEYSFVRPTVAVRTIFGASNELADQIERGGTADLFISAGKEPLDRLKKANLIRRDSRRVVASNGLAIVSTPDYSAKVLKPSDLKKLKGVPLVVADPACPLGRYTQNLLRHEQIEQSFKSSLVMVENSRAVIAALRTGAPRVGIIFSSDINNAVSIKVLLQLPIDEVATNYEAVVISTGEHANEANELLDFFQSATAANCFRRCGFAVPKI